MLKLLQVRLLNVCVTLVVFKNSIFFLLLLCVVLIKHLNSLLFVKYLYKKYIIGQKLKSFSTYVYRADLKKINDGLFVFSLFKKTVLLRRLFLISYYVTYIFRSFKIGLNLTILLFKKFKTFLFSFALRNMIDYVRFMFVDFTKNKLVFWKPLFKK
jgi:hypothetical protein